MVLEIYQKQFSIGKILSESWKRFTENLRLILIIALIVYLPINIILSFVTLEETVWNFYALVIQLLKGLIGIIATMAIAYAIKSKIDKKSISIGEALRKSLSKWGAAIGTNIILGIFLLGLTLLLIVPGIIYSVYWIFVTFVVILNDKSGKDALDYSKKIVKGRWLTVAGYSIVFGVLGFLLAFVGGIFFWFLPEHFLTSIATDTLIDLLVSFFTVVLTIFFINFDSTKNKNVTG